MGGIYGLCFDHGRGCGGTEEGGECGAKFNQSAHCFHMYTMPFFYTHNIGERDEQNKCTVVALFSRVYDTLKCFPAIVFTHPLFDFPWSLLKRWVEVSL
jgi:hypothetical protein